MPCTAIWQFILRGESYDLHVPQLEEPIKEVRPKLHMLVYMRSWDLVWGLSYDVPCFVANQMALAKSLGAEIGSYVHVAGSAHIYERHFNTNVRPGNERLEIDWLEDEIEGTRKAALNRVLEMRRTHGLT
jgi:thymidylate synthase